ncbi:uncharacterized protein [Branchiostoma lanceolatum]|uniref:uncharacterized protein n=1 Tax=Branchiostoma lanceolatum TaxID=7740 RepID=UPI0034558E5F
MRTVSVTVLVLLLSVVKASFTQENGWRRSLDKTKTINFTTKEDLRDMNSVALQDKSLNRCTAVGGLEVHEIILPTPFRRFMACDEGKEALSYSGGIEMQTDCPFATVKSVALSSNYSHKRSDQNRAAALLSTRMETAGQRMTEQRQHFRTISEQSNSVMTFARCLPIPHQFYLRKIYMFCALPVKVAFLVMSSTITFLIVMLFVQLIFRSKYIEHILDHCFRRFVLRFLLISISILVLNGGFIFIGFTACLVYETVTLICQKPNSKCRVYKCIFEYPVQVLWLLLLEWNNTKRQNPHVHSSLHVRCRRNG